ncbi:MAG: protocatechuate 3,4-dioxygenase subunit alpha [Acidobacteriota bacterium]|nr:protocatechuate 3,4-dioxygenase subunit alpha [Acidobacteriota bacterium]
MKLTPSGSQTVGPYFRIGLQHLCDSDAQRAADVDTVTVHGTVIDANGVPVSDAMLEIWHADRDGRYDAGLPDASGRPACFTRAATDDEGSFRFTIVRPGAVPGESGIRQAPHIAVLVFARGLLRHLITRMYFPDEAANSSDPVLQSIPEKRRRTLIAERDSHRPGTLEWNVVLQGDDETVFFAW